MQKSKRSSCTTVLVGKKASVDGSIMIARNEDNHTTVYPKIFTVNQAFEEPRVYKSVETGVEISLPGKGMRHTTVPDADTSERGDYGSAAFNEKNAAISATESVYGNARVLAYDPYPEKGIAEDAIIDIVAPFMTSARDGIKRLGEYYAIHGSFEGNGMLFADKDEAWYMEIACGHHWVAVRIPDDCYAVAPNMTCIDQIDFNDPENYMWSEGIREFVDKHHLNPDREGFSYKRIFGTCNQKDRVYNTPRSWYLQRYFNPEIEQSPVSCDIPFIRKANRLISLDDVAFALSNHYEETPFDPLGTGTEQEKTRFRAISLSRTQASHILQIKPELPEGLSCIHWQSMGTTAFTPYVPFFANMSETPAIWRENSKKLNLDNAYWIFKVLTALTENHFPHFSDQNKQYLYDMHSYALRRIDEIIEKAKGVEGAALTELLTAENKVTSDYVIKATKDLMSDIMTDTLNFSKLSFTMDKNL